MKNEKEILEYYKKSGRVSLVKKGEMFDFLKEYFIPDLKKSLSKDELEDLFLENLNLDTLGIYAKNLDSFGLAQKDVADFLMCRTKTISNLLEPKAFIPFRGHYGHYLIYNVYDVLAFANSKDYKEIYESESEKYQKAKDRKEKREREAYEEMIRLQKEQEEKQKKRQEEKIEFQNKILDKLPDSFIDLYPKARSVVRKFIIHIGPTNSGKTYEALQCFRKANKGIYLAPLRLLASEVYFDTNEQGIPCHLITGEEAIMTPNATHQASTIEMVSINEEYDVAVIDEAQLLSDKQRGGAWTRAILGVCAKEIHICASPDALHVLKELITRCGDQFEIVNCERKTKLIWENKKFSFPEDVKPFDAYIVFSKRAVLYCAAELEKNGIEASVIYGGLPYRVRQSEMERFINGETQVVVSTDAIGMGLNLPIRRVVFLETSKFDGERRRFLNKREVQQIAGRAGRFGVFDEGFVNSEYSNKEMRKRFNTFIPEFNKVYLNFPETLIHIEGKLSQILRQWNNMNVDEFFIHFKMDLNMCLFVESLTDDKVLNYKFLTIPFDSKNSDLWNLWKHLVRLELNKNKIDIDKEIKTLFPNVSKMNNTLDELEHNYKIYDLLYAFMYKFEHTTYLKETMENRDTISNQIIKILKEEALPIRKCSVCKKPLPWNYPYGMCNSCYINSRYDFY